MIRLGLSAQLQPLLLSILPNDPPSILASLLLDLGVGLACLDSRVLDSMGEVSLRLRTAVPLASALLEELSVSLRFRRRRVGLEEEVVCGCEWD